MTDIKIFTPQELDALSIDEIIELYNQMCTYVDNLNDYIFSRKDRPIK